METTFDKLPEAVAELNKKLEKIERLLRESGNSKSENESHEVLNVTGK